MTLGDQFKDFLYRVRRNPQGTTVAVAGVRRSDDHPMAVASMNIRASSPSSDPVTIKADENGQMHWTGGEFTPNPAHVSWLGMGDFPVGRRRQAEILSNMMAIGVQHHGSIPYADEALSIDGARIARGMAEKYGLKAHPGSETSIPKASTTVPVPAVFTTPYWNSISQGPRSEYTEYSHDQAAKVFRDMDAKYRKRAVKPVEEDSGPPPPTLPGI